MLGKQVLGPWDLPRARSQVSATFAGLFKLEPRWRAPTRGMEHSTHPETH